MRNKPVSIIASDQTVSSIPADEVRQGDRVLLSPGERAMIDMRVVTGESDIDDSFLTGESLPKTYAPGMTLHAGAINLTNAIQGEALGTADNSLLASIAEMLEAGEQRKTAYRKLADRAVSFYIPFVHTTAALAGLLWLLIGASVSEALMISVTTLIITCPCALALAAPVAQVVAAGRLFKRGIYLRSGDALERLADIDHVAFDKTGTLTIGRPKLRGVFSADTENELSNKDADCAITDAALLARVSQHPLSRALASVAGIGAVHFNVSETPGKGLSATVEGEEWRLGSAEWVGANQLSLHTGPRLFFRKGVQPVIVFAFEDVPVKSASTALDQIAGLGISCEILSGDQATSVSRLAETVGINTWRAECTPDSKVNRLEALRSHGKHTLMVGDGLNDTAALVSCSRFSCAWKRYGPVPIGERRSLLW